MKHQIFKAKAIIKNWFDISNLDTEALDKHMVLHKME